ncbi:MAG: hypothetical protein HQL41_14385 [Alphaproteobacteria bacterium]|nr:hypothetical protein [Alphaproteobacteria bacterium]
MNVTDFAVIRRGLASLDASANHTASGQGRPTGEEIFAPEQHAGALDPNKMIVLGARGTGKSFWAGVLGNDDTRALVAEAYPLLGLDKIAVGFGFTGQNNDGSVSRAAIDHQVPVGEESSLGVSLWRCVVLRAVRSAIDPDWSPSTIGAMMRDYADPEAWEADCADADRQLTSRGERVVVIFDALDALAIDWNRLRGLMDALLEVTWSMRGYGAIHLKLFLRPDQIRDLGLRFVELPKLLSGATNLRWSGTDLYGMLFAKLRIANDPEFEAAFRRLLEQEAIPPLPKTLGDLRKWPLANTRAAQARVFMRLAGSYMGRSRKKGNTYEWPLNHLADGHGEVTPQSFLTLIVQAARYEPHPTDQAFSAEGIRNGLREASKTRVEQLALEFKWIKRALSPLARLQVPCVACDITQRWEATGTIEAIKTAATQHFLLPFQPDSPGHPYEKLIEAFIRIGVLSIRKDTRYDMPDLFRVAARLLKKGGVAPA